MAVNFNLLKQAGPANFYEGLVQGQEQQRVNALTQQKIAQDQEMNALRLQQVRGEIGQQERKVKAETAAQKTAMFRDRLLRASNPNSVRELVKMQYADPDVGALLSQTGSLEQALAEVPDDPVQFERYRQQEALGMTEWMKSQLPKTVGGSIFNPAKGEFLTPPAAPKAPPTPLNVTRLIQERDALPKGDPNIAIYNAAIRKETEFPPRAGAGAGAGAAPKPMTALQQQATRKTMAADKTNVKAAQSVVGELEKLTDELVGNPEKEIPPHPGLSGITGLQAMLPSMPESLITSGNSRKAQQKLETLKGKVMAFGRQLASLEGKLGNMAVQEWKFVSDSIQAIDPAAGNLDVQLRDIVRQAKNFANTVQERYDLTYEGAEPTAPAAAQGTGGFKYLGKESK
jgi:hypothetical protein